MFCPAKVVALEFHSVGHCYAACGAFHPGQRRLFPSLLGCNVGPVMVEIKPKPAPVSATSATRATAVGGGVAAALAAGYAGATGSFPSFPV
eukprot:g14185.t1